MKDRSTKRWQLRIALAAAAILTVAACRETRTEPATPPSREWVEISIFCQVCPEPWGDDDNIEPFFASEGITVHDRRRVNRESVCEAESCPSYVKKEILVDSSQVQMVYEILTGYPGVVGNFDRLTE